MDNLIREIVFWLQTNSSAESMTIWLFFLCAVTIMAAFKKYGAFGLYVYNALAIVVANIQVLRFTQYSSFIEPVALGTVLFTTTFFVNDLLTEHYGPEHARKSVMLGFWAQVLVTVFMLLTLAHPLPDLTMSNTTVGAAHENYLAMLQLFSPSMRILSASLIAYVCSQLLDILIFNRIRKMTKGKYLWLRQNIAMLVSGTFDTFVFSFLAWMLLSDYPITWSDLFFTYILSSQLLRFMLNVCFTPLMYMSYYFVPNNTVQIHDLQKRPASV